ncbi:MAG: glycosyltransferase [Candidatus Neomarinimicrobiota bacterium]
MRIALVSPLPPYRGGISTFSHLLGLHLEARHEVYGVSFRRLYPGLLFPGKSQITRGRRGPGLARVDMLLHPLLPASWDRAAARIRAFRPDVCLFAYWLPYLVPAYLRVLRAVSPLCRTAVLCHNVEEHESMAGLRWLKRRYLEGADRLVVLSDDGRRQLEGLGVSTPTEVLFHPLYDGYGEARPQGASKRLLGVPEEMPVILFFGLVRPYKGLGQLLEAARELLRRGARFHLRVAGEFYQGYRQAAQQVTDWGLAEHVTLEDRFVPDGEVAAYFSAADVVVLPYLSATQSGVVQIAYQFERPVVVTDVGGLPETVTEGETGFVVPTGDSGALADILAGNLPDGFRALRSKVAEAKGRFSWDSFIDQLERILA